MKSHSVYVLLLVATVLSTSCQTTRHIKAADFRKSRNGLQMSGKYTDTPQEGITHGSSGETWKYKDSGSIVVTVEPTAGLDVIFAGSLNYEVHTGDARAKFYYHMWLKNHKILYLHATAEVVDGAGNVILSSPLFPTYDSCDLWESNAEFAITPQEYEDAKSLVYQLIGYVEPCEEGGKSTPFRLMVKSKLPPVSRKMSKSPTRPKN